MTGINSKDFNDTIKKINGVKYKKHNDELLYRGRKLYVLLDNSNQDKLNPPHYSAYYFWRKHQSYKEAKPNWVDMSGERILELAILLDPEDKIKGEYIEDLAAGKDNLKHVHNPEDYKAWITKSKGFVIRTQLESTKDIEELLSKLL